MRIRQPGRVRRIGDSDEYRVTVEYTLTAEERDMWGSGLVKPGLVPGWEQPVVIGGQAHFLYINQPPKPGMKGLGIWCACRERFGEDMVAAARHMRDLQLQDS